ncbi:hypothetical protein J4214_00080 [Candidatus Woesearchaeota archaeon]|nr:hypothetical protein [Candidatus Woesearchaeota archaeon]
MIKILKDFNSLLYQDIIRRNKMTPFIIFAFFLLSFSTARIISVNFPTLNIFVGDYHIHHFYYGFALLIISNWIALVTNKSSMFKLAAGIFGFGLGLIVDEIGLLLTCGTSGLNCDYRARISYDTFMIIIFIFLAVLYSEPFINILKKTKNMSFGKNERDKNK